MIPYDELHRLKAASSLKSTADTALVDSQVAAIAHELNTAANTGQYRIQWCGLMFPEVKSKLESNGYVVEEVKNVARDNNPQYVIRFDK